MMTSKVLRSLEQKDSSTALVMSMTQELKMYLSLKMEGLFSKKSEQKGWAVWQSVFGQLGPKQSAFTSALQTLSGQ